MTKPLGLILAAVLAAPFTASAQHAVQVVDYQQGSTPAGGFVDPATAIGAPEQFTGDGGLFAGVVSAFNPPFGANEIVSIGEGGSLTLRLSNFALAGTGPEIGFFTNAGLGDQDFPNGLAAGDFSGPFTTFGIDDALVEVSEDGVNFFSLGVQTFDIPSNAFTDLDDPFSGTVGSVAADPTAPFVGVLDDFASLPYSDPTDPDILDLLGGSAGGLWLDIEPSGLSQVGFVRLSVADDGDSQTSLNFELDAVSIASSAIGAPTVPEPTAALLLLAGCGLVGRTRR